jgi:hypothetical protein
MNASYIRLGFALLFMAGIIIFNGYMVLTGAADGFYGHVSGTATQPVAQAAFQGRIHAHTAVSPNDMPIQSSRFLPGHLIKRG